MINTYGNTRVLNRVAFLTFIIYFYTFLWTISLGVLLYTAKLYNSIIFIIVKPLFHTLDDISLA